MPNPRPVDPFDARGSLDAWARSYLHANCAQCHVLAGGGNAAIDLEFTTAPQRTRLFGVPPMHPVSGQADALLIAPGDPQRSVLLQRMARRGLGQMPPLATSHPDPQTVQLLRDWITQLKP